MNIIALDFGSGKINGVLAVLDKETGSIKIENAASWPSKEISGGMVLSLRPAAAATRGIIKKLTGGENDNFRLICGLRGSYLHLQRAHGFKNIIDCDTRTITSDDVTLAMESSVPSGIREKNFSLITVIPQNYVIDGKEGIKDPVGMSGFMLEVQSLVVAAFSSHFENLSRCLNMAELEDTVFLPSILALAETMLTEDEREMGCVLIDFGAEMTAFAFYHHGGLVTHKEIPMGSNFIDRDIAYLMQNPLHAAKDVKEKYKLGDDELLDEVINHRLTELFEGMQAALMENSLYFKMPPVYMVLCGGGSQLDGIVEKAKDFFKIKKVRRGFCGSLEVSNGGFSSEEYASAVALAKYYEGHNMNEDAPETGIASLKSYIKKLMDGIF